MFVLKIKFDNVTKDLFEMNAKQQIYCILLHYDYKNTIYKQVYLSISYIYTQIEYCYINTCNYYLYFTHIEHRAYAPRWIY